MACPGAVADLRFSFKDVGCRRSKQVVGFGEILVIFMWVLGPDPRFSYGLTKQTQNSRMGFEGGSRSDGGDCPKSLDVGPSLPSGYLAQSMINIIHSHSLLWINTRSIWPSSKFCRPFDWMYRCYIHFIFNLMDRLWIFFRPSKVYNLPWDPKCTSHDQSMGWTVPTRSDSPACIQNFSSM